jgi:uncharacterized protein (DUF302 family)
MVSRPDRNVMLSREVREVKEAVMSYYFTKTVSLSFDEALSRVKEVLAQEGFGVLTEIDVKDTLKKRLDVDFTQYRILGACNPPFAYKALQLEERIGTMMPCNVIVREITEAETEVSAINPLVSMQAVANTELESVAKEVSEKLQKVVESV